MFLKPEEITSMSLEITSHCNAACPMCSRYNEDWDTREPNKSLPLVHADFDQFINFLDQIPNLKHCTFSGKYGDPLMNKDLNLYLKYLHSRGIDFDVRTNGSLRPESWWEEVVGYGGVFIFGIDGLEDTSNIYRQKTDFNKVIDNATTYIDAGGKAYWDFLIFRHNEHQVEDAKRFAKALGFKSFNAKATHRFKNRGDFEYIDVDGNKRVLQGTTIEKYKNKTEELYLDGEERPKELDIFCGWKDQGKMMLGITNKLWPCCFISEHFPELPGFNTMQQIWSRHGKDFNDITKYSVKDILDHEFFANELETAWNTGKNITKECWKKCTRNKVSQTEYLNLD